MFYTAARAYAWLYVAIDALTGYGIPGLGFLLRRSRRPKFIRFMDQWLYFEPAAASSYGLHIIGRVHEPETHALLNAVFDDIGTVDAAFIDVGANIGVFLLDISRRPNVRVFGFEPSAGCVRAIRETAAKNGRQNVLAFENLVGDREGLVAFSEGKDAQGASVFASQDATSQIQQVTLDHVVSLKSISSPHTVLMIDVEGYEPQVLRGARGLLERLRPLVIFEYNHVSKRHFSVTEIQALLGSGYEIYRLGKDAMLDKEVENSWNCVAVPRGSSFETYLKARLRVA